MLTIESNSRTEKDCLYDHYKIHGNISLDDNTDDNGLKQIQLFKLHGSMSQKDRMDVFNKFRGADSDGSVLLCTDVAARGLDLPQVDWIVQVCETFDNANTRSGSLY